MKHIKKHLYFNHFLLFEDYFNEYLPAVNTLQRRIEKKEAVLKKGGNLEEIAPLKFRKLKNLFQRHIEYINEKGSEMSPMECLIMHEIEARSKTQKPVIKKFDKKVLEEKIIWCNTVVKQYNQVRRWQDSSIKRRCLKVLINEIFLLSYGNRREPLFGFKSSF